MQWKEEGIETGTTERERDWWRGGERESLVERGEGECEREGGECEREGERERERERERW